MEASGGSATEPTPGGKRAYVRQAFSDLAPRYDLLNHLLSLNVDRRWRARAVARLGWEALPEGRYLDVCAGTLDLAAALATQAGFRGAVVGADFAVPMLRRGAGKAGSVRSVGADALRLPFPEAAFDGAMVAFGVRNLTDPDAGLQEMARVLRPGARAVVLEFSLPEAWPVRPVYLWYLRRLLPWVGRVVSRHGDAYAYLPASVDAFPAPATFAGRLAAAGFRHVAYERLTLGIATLYRGKRA